VAVKRTRPLRVSSQGVHAVSLTNFRASMSSRESVLVENRETARHEHADLMRFFSRRRQPSLTHGRRERPRSMCTDLHLLAHRGLEFKPRPLRQARGGLRAA